MPVSSGARSLPTSSLILSRWLKCVRKAGFTTRRHASRGEAVATVSKSHSSTALPSTTLHRKNCAMNAAPAPKAPARIRMHTNGAVLLEAQCDRRSQSALKVPVEIHAEKEPLPGYLLRTHHSLARLVDISLQ